MSNELLAKVRTYPVFMEVIREGSLRIGRTNYPAMQWRSKPYVIDWQCRAREEYRTAQPPEDRITVQASTLPPSYLHHPGSKYASGMRYVDNDGNRWFVGGWRNDGPDGAVSEFWLHREVHPDAWETEYPAPVMRMVWS